MAKQNKWNETREALVGIAKYASDHKSGEIELRFLHSTDKTAGIQVMVRTIHNRCLVGFDHSS